MSSTTAQKYQPIYTEEKVFRLIRVYMAILSVMLLLGWQQVILLNSLQDEKVEMAHMDPSEIIATPIPILKVASFVFFPLAFNLVFWVVRTPEKLVARLVSLVKLTLTSFALLGLCGDNLVLHWKNSILASLYIGTLLASTSTGKNTSKIAEELPFTDFSDHISSCRLYCVFLFTISFQILNVLDHGKQVQRWPLPVLLGGTYGYVVGTIIGILLGKWSGEAKANNMKRS